MVGHLVALNSCVHVHLLTDDKRTGMGWTRRGGTVYEVMTAGI